MIKIDASNLIPKRLATYLVGIIPGLLFELSVAFANPLFAHQMIDRVKQVYPFQGYSLLILFAASCLVVGQTFFLLAWFTDWLIGFLYRLQRYLLLHATLGSDWLYRWVGRLQGMPPNRNVAYLRRPIMWARRKKTPYQIRPVLKCQRMSATELLQRKYGIIPSKGQWEWVDQEWQVWLSILGKTPPMFREAFLTMRTFIGCGLAQLSALYTCPTLRNRYFISITAVFLVAGCLQALDFSKRRWEPVWRSFYLLAAVMEELSGIASETTEDAKNADSKRVVSITDTGEED